MPWTIETKAPDCKGFAVVNANGKTVGCHTSRKDALAHQRALYVNVKDVTQKDDPTVSDVHVDTIMNPALIAYKRPKKPKFAKSVDSLIMQHDKLHTMTDQPNDAQLYVHHALMDAINKAGQDVSCSCGVWSEPLLLSSVSTTFEALAKSDNPSLSPVSQIIQSGIDQGYKFADVLHMLDVGGFMMVVRPKIVDEPTPMQESSEKSVLTRIKNKVSEKLNVEKEVPTSFTPPQAVQDEAKRALQWIKEGHAGSNFTDVGRARASQLANGEPVSRDTLARMKSFLARHEVDSQGQGYHIGEAGFPSPGRVAYAAWGGSAAKTWVDKLFRQFDLAKSYGHVETVYKANEQRFTLGPWYIPNQQDAHGEWTDPQELQQGLWDYVKSGDRNIRLQHNKNVVAGQWVETMTWPYDVTVPMTKADGTSNPITYPAGTVFMGVVWEPWAWDLVKAGKLTGYSIGGKSERVMVDFPDATTAQMAKHLQGKHDQRTHAHGHGGGSPSNEPRAGMGDIKITDEMAAEMQGGSAAPFLIKDAQGNWAFTPERQAMHDSIVKKSVDGIPASTNPTYVVMGGGPAAGKSTILESGAVKLPPHTVEVNSDHVKTQLPEWQTAGVNRASVTHAESSYVAKRTQSAAFERKQNIVLDGTGDTSPKSMSGKIDTAHAAGYKVDAHYVTLPTNLAIENAAARAAKTGRHVPDEVIRTTHAGVSNTFPSVATKFDSVKLYDTSVKGTARLIAEGGSGTLNIVDKVAYDGFLAKGKE
jgi:predicted ABC-type ATPase